MEEGHAEAKSAADAMTFTRFGPMHIARLLGVYSVLVTIVCAVLLALLLSSPSQNDALQQETSGNGIGSNSACESCEDLWEKLDQCVAVNDELKSELKQQQLSSHGGTKDSDDGLQSKFDQCIAAKDELEVKCGVVVDEDTSADAANVPLVEEINARLNSSLIEMEEKYSALNASNVACLRSNVELQESNIDLEAQVDTLETNAMQMNETLESYVIHTDELTEENKRLERLETILSEQVGNLTTSNTEYARQNAQLNQSLAEARQHEENLSALNRQYAENNDALSKVTTDLASEVEELKVTAADLNATALEYARLNGVLSSNVDRLERSNENLTEIVTELTTAAKDLTSRNAQLSQLNDDLGTIVSFLDEIAGGVGKTYNSMSNYLADQISQNRGLLIEVLANTYRQRTYYWICAVNSRFKGMNFMVNPNSPIGSDAYSDVLEYIDEILLTDLCFDVADFEQSIIAITGAGRFPTDVTWNELMTSVADYTADGVDYYFPSDGEKGLSERDWAEAGYMCEGLSANKQY